MKKRFMILLLFLLIPMVSALGNQTIEQTCIFTDLVPYSFVELWNSADGTDVGNADRPAPLIWDEEVGDAEILTESLRLQDAARDRVAISNLSNYSSTTALTFEVDFKVVDWCETSFNIGVKDSAGSQGIAWGILTDGNVNYISTGTTWNDSGVNIIQHQFHRLKIIADFVTDRWNYTLTNESGYLIDNETDLQFRSSIDMVDFNYLWFDAEGTPCEAVINATYMINGTEGCISNIAPTISFLYPTQTSHYNDYNGSLVFQTNEVSNCSVNSSWVLSTTNNITHHYLNPAYASLTEGEHSINVSCWDVEKLNTSTSLNFTIDTTIPSMIANIKANDTIVLHNLTIQVNLTDNIKLYSLNVTTPEGFENYTSGIDATNYTWDYTLIMNGSYSPGLHNISFYYCDSHTTTSIVDYDTSINEIDKKIIYNFDGGYYSINPKNTDNFIDVTTTKLIDRYIFEFEKKKGYETSEETYIVKSDGFIDIIWNDIYEGWLVIPNLKKWVDFDTPEGYKAIVRRVSDNEVEVTTKGSNFESTGDLNCVTELYYYYSYNTSVDFNLSVSEGTEAPFILTINATGTTLSGSDFRANLIYNNSVYVPTVSVSGKIVTFTNSITLPLISDQDVTSEDRTFYWNYTMNGDKYNTPTYSQTVGKLYIGDCGNLTNTTTLNITFKDELTGGLITTNLDGNFEVWSGAIRGSYRNESFNKTGSSSYQFCIYPNTSALNIDATFLYDATGYPVRTHYLCEKELTSAGTYYNFYHLSSGNATAVTLTLTDDSDDPLVSYYVDLLRWYPETNEYKTVEVTQTDDDGRVRNQIELYDVFYKWRFRQCNDVVKETGKNQIAITSLTYQLSIIGADFLSAWSSLEGISYNLDYDNSTTTFTMSWSDVGGEADYYCLKVVRSGGLGMTTLSDVCSAEKSGALEHTLVDFQGRIIATAYAKTSGSNLYVFLLDTYELYTSKPWLNVFGGTGLILAGIFTMTLAFVGLTVAGVTGLVVFTLAGLGLSGLVGMLGLKITIFVSLCILGGILIWKVKT